MILCNYLVSDLNIFLSRRPSGQTGFIHSFWAWLIQSIHLASTVPFQKELTKPTFVFLLSPLFLSHRYIYKLYKYIGIMLCLMQSGRTTGSSLCKRSQGWRSQVMYCTARGRGQLSSRIFRLFIFQKKPGQIKSCNEQMQDLGPKRDLSRLAWFLTFPRARGSQSAAGMAQLQSSASHFSAHPTRLH